MATGKPTGMKAHLLTTHFFATALADLGHNQGELNSQFGLCSFGWHPPRDAKIVMCMADIQCLLRLSFTVHTGTNQKAQQSCRGGTQ